MSGELPAGWEDHLPKFEDPKSVATRVASGEVINALAPVMPMLIGGSADLGVSNNTDIKSSHSFEAGAYDGRILHFGVREHAMGSTLDGDLFEWWSDSVWRNVHDVLRLHASGDSFSGVSEVQVIYVFTHDSIGLGEDGPTHQPIEHLAALRAIPHLFVIRPADSAEVSEAWRIAILRRHGADGVGTDTTESAGDRSQTFCEGGWIATWWYVLADAEADGNVVTPKLILIATVRKFRWRWRRERSCRMKVCRRALFRCRAGSCLRSNRRSIAMRFCRRQ